MLKVWGLIRSKRAVCVPKKPYSWLLGCFALVPTRGRLDLVSWSVLSKAIVDFKWLMTSVFSNFLPNCKANNSELSLCWLKALLLTHYGQYYLGCRFQCNCCVRQWSTSLKSSISSTVPRVRFLELVQVEKARWIGPSSSQEAIV